MFDTFQDRIETNKYSVPYITRSFIMLVVNIYGTPAVRQAVLRLALVYTARFDSRFDSNEKNHSQVPNQHPCFCHHVTF